MADTVNDPANAWRLVLHALVVRQSGRSVMCRAD